MAVNPNVRAIAPHERKQFEEMGVEAVRQFCSGNIWPNSQDGSTHPTKVSALIWLAEIDESERKRNEALQTEQTRLAKSASRAAWYAVYAALGALVVSLLGTAYAVYSQHEMGVAAKAEVARYAMIRNGIAKYIKTGRAIEDSFANTQRPIGEVIADRDEWVSDVERFFRDNSMESYISRFHDDSGIHPMAPMNMQNPNDPHVIGFVHIHAELVRLEEFSHELP
jgi:hypothetical protein